MKKILILSYYYPPANFVGAERIGSFAKHLHKFGIYPIIVTRNWNENQTNTYEEIKDNSFKHRIFDTHEEYYLPYNRSWRDKLFGKTCFFCISLRRILTFLELVVSTIWIPALPYANLYSQARKLLKEQKDIQALIISGSPFESFHFGYELKKEFPHIHWIPSYRDEWTAFRRYPRKSFFEDIIFKLNAHLEKKFTSNASSFISVSDYWVKRIEDYIHKKGITVMNGFEPKAIENVNSKINPNPNKLVLSYSGSVYPNQDFYPIARVLSKLQTYYGEKVSIITNFYGVQEDNSLRQWISQSFEKEKIECNIFSRIPSEELHEHLLFSDFLYVTNYGDLKGFIPVKVFDYYNLSKPILHFPTDNGEIEKFIFSTNSGFAPSTESDCYALLLESIENKRSGNDHLNQMNQKEAAFYSREHQASILAKYLNEIFESKASVYQICTRCVMDTSDEDIIFDKNGVCNHCRDFEKVLQQPRYRKEDAEQKLTELIKQVKGQGKKYDCLIGISGGVDSCYTAYLCHQWGLRPLLMHMDNGWNSEIAVSNIEKLIDKLGLDYISYVIDWSEFREIQLAFLKSSIVDLEIPTDIAIPASLYQTAVKYEIPFIMSGGNYSGEGILPLSWGYHVLKDAYLYKNIVKKYASLPLKKVPIVGLMGEIYYKFIRKIRTLYPLNLIDYDKDQAREFLKKEFGWTDYGGKHHESMITAFWQSYAMPTKYNMDYRRATYSSQIVSGQITREIALEKLKELPYIPESIPADKEYIAKKFGIPLSELEAYLALPPKTYKDFPNQKKLIQWFYRVYNRFK
ncbi:MAG: N-acetyl sugar amidotransferase [Chitinophagales bacterium]|jgi:N-acetyl sugar amidotransferase|nr:N-acetyl sugar amidotransferase [Sphingobacteriales bacterium]